MKWSKHAWASIEQPYQLILDMPFIAELSEGTLPVEKFKFYIAQDSLYLEHFGRALALIGARADDIEDALTYMRFGANAILVENDLHESYFRDFGLEQAGPVQPCCHHYIHYLKSCAALDPIEVAMAAALPCFWIYQEVGTHISGQLKLAGNPYQKWIDTYASEDFASVAQQAINCCDKVASRATPALRKRMTDAFINSSWLEYGFWQGAYDLSTWGGVR